MIDENQTEEYEFLSDAKEFLNNYKRSISKNLRLGDKALILDFNNLASQSIELADNLIERPEETIQLFDMAASETGWISDDIRTRFSSIASTQEIPIRNIRSRNIGKMIGINGVIRKASEIRPQVTNIKFKCPVCGAIISVLQIEKEQRQPGHCSCGRKGGFKEIAKDMIDSQIIVLEESADDLEDGGDQPKRIKVWLSNDLCDLKMTKRIIPGNKVKIIGILKEVKIGKNIKSPSVKYDYILEANNIIPLEEEVDDIEITEEDERTILEISKRPDLYDYLGKSVAPGIFGNDDVKKALTIQLFGGVKNIRSDGSCTREQIHGLLVGDPGTGKSVMLKYIQELSRKSRYVSGKGTSGVGLTAMTSRDEITGDWTLEAGAMVLANNGTLCIDEFEKMDESDRSNLHEGMEQGTISVSRANIQAKLNANTTILAGANPKMGRFDDTKELAPQINLIPSLLSRFDFIFIMRDIPNEERDALIVDKIFSEHCEDKIDSDFLDKETYRKYIAYSKRIHPRLGDSALRVLKNYYIGLRSRCGDIGGKKVIPMGARQIEGLIRFSEASAKMRLSRVVTIADAEYAIKIMEAYLKEVGYDEENKSFDIDKLSGNGAKARSNIDMVRDVIKIVMNESGNAVAIDKIKSLLNGKIDGDDIDSIIEKLIKNGDIFRPKKKHVQLM